MNNAMEGKGRDIDEKRGPIGSPSASNCRSPPVAADRNARTRRKAGSRIAPAPEPCAAGDDPGDHRRRPAAAGRPSAGKPKWLYMNIQLSGTLSVSPSRLNAITGRGRPMPVVKP